MTTLILFVFTVVPTTAYSTCQTIEITALLGDPCDESTLQEVIIKINHTTGDFLGGSLVVLALLFVLGGLLRPQSPHGLAKHIQKPLIPPPRFS